MYNESYEEYIRSILGYPNYQNTDFMNTYNNDYIDNRPRNVSNAEIEECYPEIYKIIYPMVRKASNDNIEPISPDLIERMTDEIYSSIEADNIINVNNNVNINLTSNPRNEENRNTSNINNNPRPEFKNSTENRENRSIEARREDKTLENRGEDRQFRNRNLRDLIKILLIRELLGGIRNPGRPPMPPSRPPMRPPFPGGPGMPGRPPFGPGPRQNDRYYDLYEY